MLIMSIAKLTAGILTIPGIIGKREKGKQEKEKQEKEKQEKEKQEKEKQGKEKEGKEKQGKPGKGNLETRRVRRHSPVLATPALAMHSLLPHPLKNQQSPDSHRVGSRVLPTPLPTLQLLLMLPTLLLTLQRTTLLIIQQATTIRPQDPCPDPCPEASPEAFPVASLEAIRQMDMRRNLAATPAANRLRMRLQKSAKATCPKLPRKTPCSKQFVRKQASKEVPSPEIHKSGTSDEKRRERKAKRDSERRSDEHLSASNATGRPTDIPNGRRRGSSNVSKDDFMPGGTPAYGPAPPPHMFTAASLPTGQTYPTHGSPTGGYPTTARPQRRHSVSSPSMEKMQARGMRSSPIIPAKTSTHPSPMMGPHTAPMSVPPAVVPPAMQHQDSGSPNLSGSYKTYTICIPDNGDTSHNSTATVEIPTHAPNNSTLWYAPTPQGLKLNHFLPAPGEGAHGAPGSPTGTPAATPTSNYSTASQSQHSQYSQSSQSQSAKSNSPNSARSVPRRSNTINMGSPHLGLPAGGFEFSGYQGLGKNAVSPGLSRASTSYSSHSGHSAHSGSTVRQGFVPPMQGGLRREETWG
ncbi:hypothetical protein BZA77DRAFT_154145 [Pyronema omphalodes]|nr:hypothetical protein BZA77DRAFT_154145 [Pyronema omphalodes]